MEFTKLEEIAVAETLSIKEESDARQLAAMQLVVLGGGLAEASLV